MQHLYLLSVLTEVSLEKLLGPFGFASSENLGTKLKLLNHYNIVQKQDGISSVFSSLANIRVGIL